MAFTEKRDLEKKDSCIKLQEVAELGQSLGLWSIKKMATIDDDYWRFAGIVTPDNLHFDLSGGSWNNENKIGVSLSWLKLDDQVKAGPRDVMSYSEPAAPEIRISSTKTAAQIVKEIKRRMLDNPVAIDIATKINARIACLQTSQSGLKQHVAALLLLGFTKGCRFDESATHSVEMHRDRKSFKVYESGEIRFETQVDVSNIAAVLAVIGGSK